ncbi:MAG TPA: phosphatase PAP2 family protein [Rhizomicrobium sp.]|jgi:membrane-associated phospholipid phosphatase|nr:phosphatase PAP2 family protein [Rhizomicrobium sp.]
MILLWAGVFFIVLGAGCFAIDRQAAHALYDHESAAFQNFLEKTTHWAKAAHWLVAAVMALVVAKIGLAWRPGDDSFTRMWTYAWAFIVCLGAGSAILHGMKLVVGRRRPRDDMEMGLYEFVWFKFDTAYNSFPSGHSLTITMVAVIASCVAPGWAIVWFAVAFWLSVTRALLTAHFLSDVFIGGGIGLLAARETLLYLFPQLPPPWF